MPGLWPEGKKRSSVGPAPSVALSGTSAPNRPSLNFVTMDTRPASRRLGLTASLLAFTVAYSASLHAADIFWSSTAGTTAWDTVTNWTTNARPVDDFTTDIAVFNQTAYTNQPTLGTTRSVAGVRFGDGSTATAATTIGGTLRIGATGVSKLANSGAATFTGAQRLGSSQSWTNDSATALTFGTFGTTSSVGANSSASTLTLNGSGSGQTVVHNVIANVNATVSVNVGRTGSGSVLFTNANTYSGGTTLSSGVLLVNNGTGSGTGSGAVNVASSATLGGSGTISGATTAAAGSFLAPGSDSGVAGTLTFGGNLDVSGLASGAGGLLFNLDGSTASDKIALTAGALTIGTGLLNLNDFDFTALSGFGEGVYTLVDTSTSIVGTLGANLTGTVGGLSAVLSLANGGQDIVLTVTAIPEPTTCATLFGALALVGAAVRHKRRNGPRLRA